MRRGTTPTYALTVDGFDLTDKTVYVTIAQGTRKITLTNDRLAITSDETGSSAIFELSQAETLAFKNGSASVQMRFIDSAGEAWATDIGSLSIDPVLLEREIAYADD